MIFRGFAGIFCSAALPAFWLFFFSGLEGCFLPDFPLARGAFFFPFFAALRLADVLAFAAIFDTPFPTRRVSVFDGP
jgi:hypothetical protein